MKDILLKRNKLKEYSRRLRSIKFDEDLTDETINKINKEQQELQNKYKFYDKFIKERNKIK